MNIISPVFPSPLRTARSSAANVRAFLIPPAKSAISGWPTADFNARNLGEVCDLFAPDLRYDFQGLPERSYNDICKLLHTSLSDASKRFTYLPPAIKEIMVSGDLAVVRLTWTLKVRNEGASGDVTSEEVGLDVFRRQPDGRWKIIRYTAFEAP